MAGTAFSAGNWTGYDEQSATNPSSALTDFTLLIDVSTLSSTFKSTVQSDGGDIRLTKGDNTELPYDLIDWAYNAGAPTGWIRVKWSSTLAASGTQNVRVWAGYTGGTAVAYDANETYGSDNAYDSLWIGYWPLHDVNDRTSNGLNLTANGGVSAGDTVGKVGAATDFDGSGDYFSVAYDSVVNPAAVTVMAWLTGTQTTSWQGILSNTDDASFDTGITMQRRGESDDVCLAAGNGGSLAEVRGGGFSSSVFKHYVGTSEDGAQELWENASSVDTASGSGTITPDPDNEPLCIGRGPIGRWDGVLDEVQMHSVVRSDAWIAEEYAQSNSQSTFWGTWAWTTAAGASTILPQMMQLA